MPYATTDDLHDAARVGDLAAIQRLLADGADPEDWSDHDDAPAIVVAAASGQIEAVRLLLDSGAQVDGYAEYGETGLHLAASEGRIDICRLLLDRGARINGAAEGGTPLAFAAQAGQTECVQFLLEEGADIDQRDELSGYTALDWAREGGQEETVAVLEGAAWDKTHDSEGLPLTYDAFVRFVGALASQHQESHLSLDHYLRAIWTLLQEHHNALPSFALLARLLSEGFTVQPAPFQSEWLTRIDPVDEASDDMQGTIDALQETLLFQIADLARMGDDLWNDPFRYFGHESPSGNTWYNFEPANYLHCAASGLQDHGEHAPIIGTGWRILYSVLELGRVYE